MNQVYVILGWKTWFLLGKKIGLWYAHGHTSFSLYLAEKFSHIIFTSTASGFRLKSKKVRIVGQGIDTDIFTTSNTKKKDDKFNIISIGRISPIKDYETLINAVEILSENGLNLNVNIVGGVGLLEQEEYLASLKQIIKSKGLVDIIHFKGAVPNKDIVALLQQSDLFVNTSHTGSLDKAILEAMSAGVPVLTCNEAMLEVLGGYREKLMYPKKDFKALSEKIVLVMNMSTEEKQKMTNDLREIVEHNHNLKSLTQKVIKEYSK
jgi:glycosyltransferase involved in cell wall biosynthesis